MSRSRSHSVNGGAGLESDDSAVQHAPNNDRTPDEEEDDADLFGDEDEAERPEQEIHRKLNDSELDSGDDEGRRDRLEDTVENARGEDAQSMWSERRFLPTEIARIQAPETENNELYLLNMPPFLGLNRKNFDPDTYESPKEAHDGSEAPDTQFSSFSMASSTAYWRRDPLDTTKLQSNTRIIRWSDGSLTLQLASSPKDQYRISTTALRQTFGNKNKPHASGAYDPNLDANYYLGAPHQASSMLQVVAPLDAAMKIQPTGQQADDSVQRLQASLAAASATHDPFAAIKNTKEDPDLARKRAELAEKEWQKSKRKTEAEKDRLYMRREKVIGRGGLSRGAGLSVAGLEDDDGMPTTARPKKGMAARPKRNRRGDILSDDEDEGYPRGRTKEDEYDLDDGFMAASDEEPEIYEDEDAPGEEEDDPDVDDLEIQGRETVVKGKTRGENDRVREPTPKRALDEDIPAAASGSPHAGRKKRRVIDDDDDDE